MLPQEFGLNKAQYSVNETLTLLSIGRNSLYALIHSGEIAPIKFGRKTLIAAPDIVRVILARRGASLPMVYKTPDPNSKPLAKRGRPAKTATLECEGV
jgi:hypothetical protein